MVIRKSKQTNDDCKFVGMFVHVAFAVIPFMLCVCVVSARKPLWVAVFAKTNIKNNDFVILPFVYDYNRKKNKRKITNNMIENMTTVCNCCCCCLIIPFL